MSFAFAPNEKLSVYSGEFDLEATVRPLASVLPGDRQLCIDAGMDDFVAKPANIESLMQILNRFERDIGQGSSATARPVVG